MAGPVRPWLAWVLAIVVVAVPAVGAVSVAIGRGHEDPRAAAARWLQANVPATARVMNSHEGPRFRATVTTARHRPIAAEQFAIVESGGIDVFVLMSSMTTRMQMASALQNHPDVAQSHLKLYEWVKANADLKAEFHPSRHFKGYSVAIYVRRGAGSP